MMTIVENQAREEQEEAAGGSLRSSSYNSLESNSDSDALSGSEGSSNSDDDDSDAGTGAGNGNSQAVDEYMAGNKKNKNKKEKSSSTPNDITFGNDFLHMAKILTQVVLCSKVLVYVVLVLAAAAAGAVTYVYTSRVGNAAISQLGELSNSGAFGCSYQEAFTRDASELAQTMTARTQHLLNVAQSWSIDYTSHSTTVQEIMVDKSQGSGSLVFGSSTDPATTGKFPYVTLPDFERKAQQARDLLLATTSPTTSAIQTVFLPLVSIEQVVSWENYTTKNQGWYYNQYEEASMPFPTTVAPIGSQTIQLPSWQMSPAPLNATETLLIDTLSFPIMLGLASKVMESRQPVLSSFLSSDDAVYEWLKQQDDKAVKGADAPTMSILLQPIFASLAEPDADIAGIMLMSVPWASLYLNQPPVNSLTPGMQVVMTDSCSKTQYTYQSLLDDKHEKVEFILQGLGDLHNPNYTDQRVSTTLTADHESMFSVQEGSDGAVKDDAVTEIVYSCEYKIDIYPSETFEQEFQSMTPTESSVNADTTPAAIDTTEAANQVKKNATVATAIVVIIFLVTGIVFLLYDFVVQLRQEKVMKTATKTQAIVSSLFPKSVQDRMMKQVEEELADEAKLAKAAKSRNKEPAAADSDTAGPSSGNGSSGSAEANKGRTKDKLNNFLSDSSQQVPMTSVIQHKSKPIADLFPEATIIFADIVGFTAWSSMREPSQVFTLLETIYHSLDQIANRRRVFKIETVGDCYVAVVGLPEPRKDHAVVMARFARDCHHKFNVLVKKLVVELGPDTEELKIRIGLHSGPVTAGVLRGERSRFQLFGDTVNTTSRMESTGKANKIHVSADTANLLTTAGKGHWITPRTDRVIAKGKGELQTFWLDPRDVGPAASVQSSGTSADDQSLDGLSESGLNRMTALAAATTAPVLNYSGKHNRLVSWNTDIMSRLLRQIIARRESCGIFPDPLEKLLQMEADVGRSRLAITEVREVIDMPDYDLRLDQIDPSTVVLSHEVTRQLHDYVQTVAAMYRENPFHNFEHASHVTMSVQKLLSRIVAPDISAPSTESVHKHSYGLSSDPLTQFAVVLSALIHDADHPGVTNAQLVKEGAGIAAVYQNKSVAEQNSVDLAWDLLMEETYYDLRRAIYVTEDEFRRFRALIVNIVLATDIMDKDLGALRVARWNKAFNEESVKELNESPTVDINRKATIVMEHLIQASDVAHTMQHWHIYRKWNARLFEEMYDAYTAGRMEKDPSENWYNGEKGFFDFYIIPLAKKLKNCGVFGVSSDEYLQYAQQNRKEWEIKGQQIVQEMIYNMKKGKRDNDSSNLSGASGTANKTSGGP